jgi:GWxTD domain-containing protein
MKRLILVALLLSAGCVSVRLENSLPPKIRAWYDEHYFIMEYQVPAEVDRKCPTERFYFLKLTPDLREKYIELFWQMREIGMKEEYDLRLEVCRKWFKGEGINPLRTDQGQVMLLCGQPDYVEFRDQNGELYMEGNEEWEYLGPGERRFQIWKYWFGQGIWQQLIDIRFEWLGSKKWQVEREYSQVQQMFFDHWKWRTAPTEDGWRLWHGVEQ